MHDTIYSIMDSNELKKIGSTTEVKKKYKKHRTKPRSHYYAMLEKHAPEAIQTLLELMRDGDNHNVRLGAARTVLNKVAPDLRILDINPLGDAESGELLIKFTKNADSGDSTT